ncbi:MAG: hypothetical protein DHS20C18_39990 [Saprospiraceae bacterium]|nr:MAG: hypothetical protein DHS20C18_39990 [Saprospiraceae bacterium]
MLSTIGVTLGQSETFTCPNGASVTATANSFTDAGGGTQCNVNITITSTIFNSGQRMNYVGVGNPSNNSNLYNGNYGGTFPNTASNTGTITINLPCTNVDMGAIEIRQDGLTGILCGNLVLPVELSSFTAKPLDDAVQLAWVTNSEINNAGFEIERSKDGKIFERLGTVPGNGTTNTPKHYSFRDKQPLSGLNYYRLRQIDLDGNEEIHLVISIFFKQTKTDRAIIVFPTIASDQLYIELSQEIDTNGELWVSTLFGHTVLSKSLASGDKQVSIDIQKLPKGQYILMVKTGNNLQTSRFVKE